jgi:predicted small lipoprotein YifL
LLNFKPNINGPFFRSAPDSTKESISGLEEAPFDRISRRRNVMKKIVLAAALAASLSACGQQHATMVAAPLAANAPITAKATQTLLNGHRQIYMALFQKLDANEDGFLDEYEASAAIDVKDFAKADNAKTGKLSKRQFMAYADGSNGVLGFLHQSRTSFASQARDAMLKAFARLDKNKDRYLQPSELTEDALHNVDVNLRIDALHVNVHLEAIDDDIFTQANHTETGKLTQAEWEDYCILAFIKAVNPNYKADLGTTSSSTPAADPAPADTSGDTSSSN